MKELKKGDRVWLKPFGNQARYTKEPKQGTVTSIGSKFVTVSIEGNGDCKFYRDGLSQATNYSTSWVIYESKEAIEVENAINKMNSEIYEAFRNGRSKYDYATVKAIHMILFPEKHQPTP